jgi:hypothetical protein
MIAPKITKRRLTGSVGLKLDPAAMAPQTHIKAGEIHVMGSVSLM